MANYNSEIVALTPLPNDVETTFNTPVRFVAGTVKIIINGQVYEPDDTRKGYAEASNNAVIFNNPPRTGDVIQAFLQNADTEGQDLSGVKGSPFDPNGVWP